MSPTPSPLLTSASAERPPALKLSGIRKSFPDGTQAVRGIDLEIPEGCFATLLGPSGSGKTTLLRVIAGFAVPDAGSVSLFGVNVTSLPPRTRKVGMVFQNYALFPHLTAAENVAYPLRARGVAKSEWSRLVGEFLDRVQLSGLGNRYPHQLSGGQQQRVALARALVYHPRLLLLDEPLGSLDKRLRGDMQLLFKQLHRDLGITFIHVTHDQTEALALSSIVALIRAGLIEQIGSPEELYRYPRSLFVADFIGESNLLPCRLTNHTTSAATIILGDGSSHVVSIENVAPSMQLGDGEGVLLLRPEDAVLREGDLVARGVTVVGTVGEMTFMGSHFNISLNTGFSTVLIHTLRAVEFREQLIVTWRDDRCRVLPRS